MPRNQDKDIYPDETSISELRPRHEAYVKEAVRLRVKYQGKIKILIGFEGEWIRHSYAKLVKELAANPNVDFFIGSVHHVHEVPIDYDKAFYIKAREVAGGTDEKLFEGYFDAQFEMLKALRPKVVGHFDLIRLLSEEPNRDLRGMEGVWWRVVRNLRAVVEQGGLVEVNSSGLRKGLMEPYPGRSVCEEFLKMGGRLTLSDDSHGIEQVGTNFKRAVEYLETLRVKDLYYLDRQGSDPGARGRAILSVSRVALSSVKEGIR